MGTAHKVDQFTIKFWIDEQKELIGFAEVFTAVVDPVGKAPPALLGRALEIDEPKEPVRHDYTDDATMGKEEFNKPPEAVTGMPRAFTYQYGDVEMSVFLHEDTVGHSN